MSSASNIVAHVARCAPDELTKQHAELAMYRDPATVWYKGRAAPAAGVSLVDMFANANVNVELAMWVLRDMRPFRAVEGEGFKDMMQRLAPKVKLPSADTISRVYIIYN